MFCILKITNPKNGENIIIGYGSAIVRKNRSSRISRKLQKMSKQQALMRAKNSLVSFLQGDKIIWDSGFDENQIEKSEQYEDIKTPEGKEETRVFENTKDTFLNTFKMSEDFNSITKGKLPPGVKNKSFIDESGDWAFAIAVFSNSMTTRSAKAGRENKAAANQLDKSANYEKVIDPEYMKTRKMQLHGGVNEKAANPKGPSGIVTEDSNL